MVRGDLPWGWMSRRVTPARWGCVPVCSVPGLAPAWVCSPSPTAAVPVGHNSIRGMLRLGPWGFHPPVPSLSSQGSISGAASKSLRPCLFLTPDTSCSFCQKMLISRV